jgi:hypothetical protein
MVGPSISCALMQREINEVVNEVLDNVGLVMTATLTMNTPN